MNDTRPSLIRMIRAPFLSSIISPLLLGTLFAVSLTGTIDWVNFVLVMLMGISLHGATNVYNDIYDTKQGTDKINMNRNEFSGGSGILVNHPELMSVMYRIARIFLVIALMMTFLLYFRINDELRIPLISLYLLSAFFSKYYTAAPVKLAYRGWGEISVWLAFGPMAVLVAAVSQNVGWENLILTAMPITGISTLSILLIGQMIDLDADEATGKWGVAVRLGTKFSAYLYLTVQILLVINVAIIAMFYLAQGWLVLLSLIPYVLLLPKIAPIIISHHHNAKQLKTAAKINVLLHLSFSTLMTLTLLLLLLL